MKERLGGRPVDARSDKVTSNLGITEHPKNPARPFLAAASLATRLRMNSGVACVKPPPSARVFQAGSFAGTISSPASSALFTLARIRALSFAAPRRVRSKRRQISEFGP
jgi:predicted RNase H-like nuclease